MTTLTDERMQRLAQNGYTVIPLLRGLYLVRKYSRFCVSSFWKRHCPIYCLVMEKEEE